ncbi:MAG: Lon-insertion domain-containing protein, partial [Kiloniellales bacterium]
EVRIQSPAQALGMLSTISLEPEPIPIEVKVAIVGERTIYYLLAQHDPEFSRLFKVAADFDERIPRNEANDLLYARLIKSLVAKEELRPLDRGGVARALEFSAREAGDAERFSMQLETLADVLREADHLAGKAGRKVVTSEDVEGAADARIYRLDRVRERIQEEIERGTIVIDTDGAEVGRINGLSVMGLGGISFGRPNRITARVRLGKGEVVDIEREVALGGPLHSKGVLILSGYLSAHYASERPLSLSASLVFEQSYGGVDGDSASSAELYALISAISGVPLAQFLAVTGSVDQYGEVQAIGGVNEKIEGFFDLCAARGLSGRQGVMIPATNVKHLMLHRRVLEAAAAGKFHIFPVATIDQGIEILTGKTAGARGADGHFPKDSVNALVEARLIELAERRRAFGRPGETEGGS